VVALRTEAGLSNWLDPCQPSALGKGEGKQTMVSFCLVAQAKLAKLLLASVQFFVHRKPSQVALVGRNSSPTGKSKENLGQEWCRM
jgi:hypothetical protein